MNKENLIQQIKLEFKNVTLDDYTLAEEDYADTSYWYFDKIRTDLNLTEDEWVKQELIFFETGGWLRIDQEEAVRAIQEKRKMINRFSNPLDIPTLYLNNYATGYSFLKPKAYLFYTPAIMLNFLVDDNLYSESFDAWLRRLSWADDYQSIKGLLIHFNEKQITLLVDFLKYIVEIKSVELNSEKLEKSLVNIQLLEKGSK